MMTDGNRRKPGESGQDNEEQGGIADLDNEEYDTMALLDQLESLEEELEELGVTTLAEVRQRIHELHEKLGG
jgi:hypothetical protein